MAARKIRKLHQEDVRRKIQCSQLVNRLQKHVDGDIELSATQISAANSLLDRSLSKLSQVQLTGDEDKPIAFELIERVIVDK